MRSLLRIGCGLLLAGVSAGVGQADEIRIVTWNAANVLSLTDVQRRGDDFRQFARELQPDILLLQEVSSADVVRAMREMFHLGQPDCGYDRASVVCSRFTAQDPRDREVAILSRFPLNEVIEFDQSPDNPPGGAAEQPLLHPGLEHLPATEVDRGFLWARIDSLNLNLTCLHLKSSRGAKGDPDRANAQQREYVAAAVCVRVLEDLSRWPDATIVVGGDIKIGATDAAKQGRSLTVDSLQPVEDGYDDTHAILTEGLVRGVRLVNLTAHVGETYLPVNYNSGAIDNLFVYQPQRSLSLEQPAPFSRGQKSAAACGSDHAPVFIVWQR